MSCSVGIIQNTAVVYCFEYSLTIAQGLLELFENMTLLFLHEAVENPIFFIKITFSHAIIIM